MTLDIVTSADLRPCHTMALQARANHLVVVRTIGQLRQALAWAQQHGLPLLVLGGGSNVLFAGDYPGLVVQMATRGIELLEEDATAVRVKVAAGEPWDAFLKYCLQHHWHGLENLAIIPGTVGAAPIQNIGAYGQEVAERIESVHIIYTDSLQEDILSAEACRFVYRDSIFKHELAGRCIITAVVFRLEKQFVANLVYQALAEAVAGEKTVTADAVRQAVIGVRQSKLPDPANVPNSGSYFKNPVVSGEQARALQQQFPDMPVYPQPDGGAKVAAGWLIEKAGWKGRVMGKVGVYPQQALVLVNQGGASYADLARLEAAICQDVGDKFGIRLEREPVLVGQ